MVSRFTLNRKPGHDSRFRQTERMRKTDKKNCNIRKLNDKSQHIEGNRRKRKESRKNKRKITLFAHAVTCVKGINALYYRRLLALDSDEC